MDFALSEEQLQLQDSLDRMLVDRLPLERVRDVVEEGASHDDEGWQVLAELGVPGLLVPEQYGGAGLNLLDAALVQETLGRHVAPLAWLGSGVLGPLALASAGSDTQKERWLPAFAEGSLHCAVALSEATGARDGAGVKSESGTLSGTALFVHGNRKAEIVLVAATDGLVYLAQMVDAEYSALESIDKTQCLGELRFDFVAAEPLGSADTLPVLLDAARVMLAADTLGAAQHMLEKAVAYAGERKQFNRVIASFQAVKHLCAEMAAEIEPARSLVWYAAHAFDAVPEERHLVACHAKAHLAEIGRFVARTATEVHGGMGFTDLLGLHYWFKRIGLNRQLLGSPERLREEAARAQGWA